MTTIRNGLAKIGHSVRLIACRLLANDLKKWLELLHCQSSTFPDGRRQVYRIVKEFGPRPKIVLTHDSHGTFDTGVRSNS